MSGSIIGIIVMPFVFAIALVIWIGMIFYANRHPHRGRYSIKLPTEVRGGSFQAREGGRQLAPIHGNRAAVARAREEAGGVQDENVTGVTGTAPIFGGEPIAASYRAEEISTAPAIQSQSALVDEPPPAPALVEVPPARRPAAAPSGQQVPRQRGARTRPEPTAHQVAQDARHVAEDSVRLLAGRVAGALRSRRH